MARALKSPLFAVSDSELLAAVQAAQAAPGGKISNPTLWERIKKLTENGGGGEALSRARRLLENWLAQTFASRLPAHDLLSVVFAQGEVEARYAACLPPPQRARGIENLRRFLGFSLSLHGGRRPLPAQFSEDADALAEEDGESFSVGDGARVSTIHKAKGMEAAIVILLESNLSRARARGKAVAGVAEVEWAAGSAGADSFFDEQKIVFVGAGARGDRGQRGARAFAFVVCGDDAGAAGAVGFGRRRGRERFLACADFARVPVAAASDRRRRRDNRRRRFGRGEIINSLSIGLPRGLDFFSNRV